MTTAECSAEVAVKLATLEAGISAVAASSAKTADCTLQLVTLGDFFKHGLVVLVLSFAVLWGWAFFGYWRIIGF